MYESLIQNGKFTSPWTCFALTLKCNLKCKLCQVKAPYYNIQSPSLSVVKSQLYQYVDIIEYTHKFDISGGEPLLYKELPYLLNFFKENRGSFGRIRINTNGTVVPTDDVLKAFQELGSESDFLIDQYEVSNRVEEIVSKLDKFHLQYEIRNYRAENPYCGGWVDYGDFSSVVSKKAECDLRQGISFFLIDGKLLNCCAQVYHYITGIPRGIPVEMVDIIEQIDISSVRQKCEKLFNQSGIELCLYCKGRCADSERFTPAEQLK